MPRCPENVGYNPNLCNQIFPMSTDICLVLMQENPAHLSNNNNTALTDTPQTDEETADQTEELPDEVAVSPRTAALDNHVEVVERTHV